MGTFITSCCSWTQCKWVFVLCARLFSFPPNLVHYALCIYLLLCDFVFLLSLSILWVWYFVSGFDVMIITFEYRDSNFGEKITSSYTIFPFNRLADKHEWWENFRDRSAMDKDVMDEDQVLNLFLIRCFVSLCLLVCFERESMKSKS